MMKLAKILSVLLISGLMASNMANASNHNSSFSFNKLSQSLCKNAENDQLFQLRSNLRRAKTHIRSIYPQISCNGQTLLSLATDNQAESVVVYLNLKANPEVTSQQNQQLSAK